MRERLQKFLARSGIASRRKSEEYIVAGRVQVNGNITTELGTTVDSAIDRITVDGKPVSAPNTLRYVVVYKPVGYVCTRAKFKGEHSIYELVPDSASLVIAGRLDKDSEGLVLLTNDGEFVNKLTHPKFQHEKEYEIEVQSVIQTQDIQRLKEGVQLEEGLAIADHVEVVGAKTIRMTLHQGWNRQIRRMLGAVNHRIVRLRRIRMGTIQLDDLPVGKYREIQREREGV